MNRKSSKKYKAKSIKKRKITNEKLKIKKGNTGEKNRINEKGKNEKSNAGKIKKTVVEISESKGEPVKEYYNKSQKEKKIKPDIKRVNTKRKKQENKKETIKNDKTLPVVNAKVEVSTNKKTTIQKSASIGWKYFLDKQGNPLMKIYTENSLVYFKLEKYGEIKKSARYYTHKGDLIGADFIIPFNLIPTACDLAGIKTPKGIPVVLVG